MKILAVRVDAITYQETLQKIHDFIKSRKPHQICTVNPEFIMASQKDPEFLHIINNCDICTPDGIGLLFIAKLFYKRIIYERVTGTDLVEKIADFCSKKGYKLYLLGGKPGIAKLVAKILKSKYPNLNIAGTFSGNPKIKPISKKVWQTNYQIKKSFDLTTTRDLTDSNLEIIQKITKTKPHILLVAYGAPKQDKFIARYKKELGVPVMLGVGGAFDFISGRARRAPKIFQSFCLEWFWRFLHQPWRAKRIFTATVVFPLTVILEKLFKRN